MWVSLFCQLVWGLKHLESAVARDLGVVIVIIYFAAADFASLQWKTAATLHLAQGLGCQKVFLSVPMHCPPPVFERALHAAPRRGLCKFFPS